MPTNKWILPEGVEDILPEQAYWLEIKRREVVDIFLSYGYGLVVPPLIEYHDSLLTNSSDDLDLQTFKLIDNKIKFTDIVNVIFEILNIYSPTSPSNISDVIEIDKLARSKTLNYIKGFN